MLLALFAVSGCRQAPTPQPPDRVMILVDTLRWDALGYAGQVLPTSPALDALALEAAWWERAYAPSTWTLPSTASLLTGLYPSQHLVIHDHHQPEQFGRLRESIPSLATTLKAQGYRTGAFVNNAFMAPEFGLQQGFDRYDLDIAPPRDRGGGTGSARAEPAFLLLHLMEPHADYERGHGISVASPRASPTAGSCPWARPASVS